MSVLHAYLDRIVVCRAIYCYSQRSNLISQNISIIIVKQTFSDFLRVSSTRIVPSHFYAIFYFVLCIQLRVIHLNM